MSTTTDQSTVLSTTIARDSFLWRKKANASILAVTTSLLLEIYDYNFLFLTVASYLTMFMVVSVHVHWKTCSDKLEFTSDPMIDTPEETVMRQHMQNDIYELLQGLHPRERQVLILRNGLWDGRCRSLEEIGRLCKRTKEWIRKIERSALKKLRQENIQKNLSPYLNLQL